MALVLAWNGETASDASRQSKHENSSKLFTCLPVCVYVGVYREICFEKDRLMIDRQINRKIIKSWSEVFLNT